MLDEAWINAICKKQAQYAVARRAGTTLIRKDNAELRKAWLKQHFGSYEYHEKLLEVHQAWLSLIKAALD